MKKNNKGFMLFETLVVSTFVLGTLIFLYIQLNPRKPLPIISLLFVIIMNACGSTSLTKRRRRTA